MFSVQINVIRKYKRKTRRANYGKVEFEDATTTVIEKNRSISSVAEDWIIVL